MQKSGLTGRTCDFRKLTAGLVSQVILFFPPPICLYLLVFAKIGSSEGVESLQNQIFFENCGATRRFFFGRAERKPNIFLGGMSF